MDLHTFFNPTSIAVIGVSDNTKKVGYLVAKNCIDQGFEGDLYFINPKLQTLLGKKVLPSVASIGKPVDLAVLAVPADVALSLLDELHAQGITNVLIFAAQFKEVGGEGAKREQMLLEKAHAYGMTIQGPNCIGFVNTSNKTNVTFLKHVSPSGGIGFISQSGALGSLMVDYLVGHKNFGFSYFISLGNKSIMDESDLLEFLADDPSTKVIAMYLEDVKNGERFKKVLAATTRKKPVVILKSGTTSEGSKAAVSHTGSMVGDDRVYSCVFEQCGAIRAEQFFEFMTMLKIYSFGRAPLSGDIMILSNAGGVGVLLTDQLVKEKLRLVTITEEVKKNIIVHMGGEKISFHNPIDLLGDASAFHYKGAIESTLKEKNIGAVIILLTPQANTEIEETAQIIASAQREFNKPIYPVFMGEKSVGDSHTLFEEERIPSFFTYDFLPRALAKMVAHRDYMVRTDAAPAADVMSVDGEVSAIMQSALGKKSYLNLTESLAVFKASGVAVTPTVIVSSLEELRQAVAKTGFPVVLKIVSDTITHKTEVKGVVTNVKDDEELTRSYKYLTGITGGSQVLVQQQMSGYELIAGTKHDSNFGTIAIVGIGGIYAELIHEVVEFVYPFSEAVFLEKLQTTKLNAFVKGFRGGRPLNTHALYESIQALCRLMVAYPAISSIDVNPFMVATDAPVAVDGRIVLT